MSEPALGIKRGATVIRFLRASLVTRCVLNYKLSRAEVHLCCDSGCRRGSAQRLARFSRQFHYHWSRIRSHSINRAAAYQPRQSCSAQINLKPGEGDKTHRRVPLVCSRRDRSRSISHCDSPPATTPDKSGESEAVESTPSLPCFPMEHPLLTCHETVGKFVGCFQFAGLERD